MAVSRKIPESLLTCLHCLFGELQILEEIGKLCSEGFRPVLLRAEAVVFPAIRTNSHPHPGTCLYHGSNPSPVCRELQSNQHCSMSVTWVFLSGFTTATVVQWQLCSGEGQSFVVMADFWDSSQRIFFRESFRKSSPAATSIADGSEAPVDSAAPGPVWPSVWV